MKLDYVVTLKIIFLEIMKYAHTKKSKLYSNGENYKNTINDVLHKKKKKTGNSLVLSLANLLNAAEKQVIRVYHHLDLYPVDFLYDEC